MSLTPREAARRLERQGAAVLAVLTDLSDAEFRRRPAPGKWSALEVINHLADEERDDFRRRVELTLADPEADWPPIDPEGWCRDRNYNDRDPGLSLEDFREERRRSVTWLRGLGNPSWDNAHAHPALGALRAGDLMASWIAHDLLHVRQLVNLALVRAKEDCAPYRTAYAGE